MRAALTWIGRRFRPIAVGAAALGLGLALWAERGAVSAVDWTVHWPGLVGSVPLFALAALGGCLAFWFVLHDLTGTAPLGETTRVWVRSFLARYVPSGALTIAVRVRAHRSLGASQGQIWSASGYEQLASALAGATVTVVTFALASRRPPTAALLILPVGIALALVFRRRLATRWLSRLRGESGPGVPVFADATTVLVATLFDLLGWLVAGAAVWLLVDSIRPGQVSALFLVGAYSCSWLLGFLALPVPSGFGVREAAFVAFLAPEVGVGAATVLAVALRLADILGELVLFLAMEALFRYERKPRTRAVPS
jgi:hypothetical protein